MRARSDGQIELRAYYVDTGPVQERVYAQYAGLGWIGRNTCVINAELGSWLFLSEIICSLPLEPDRPALDQCGSCRLCLDACPTGALVGSTSPRLHTLPVVSDHRGAWRDSRSRHATRLARTPTAATSVRKCVPGTCSRPSTRKQTRHGCLVSRSISRRWRTLWRTPDPELRGALKKSAMTRAGVKRLRRNVAVCAGATGDEEALTRAAGNAASRRTSDPLVAEHVAWALDRRG